MSEPAFCPSCGTQRIPESSFCGSCGQGFPDFRADRPLAGRSDRPLIFGIRVIAIVTVAVGAYALMGGRRPGPTSAPSPTPTPAAANASSTPFVPTISPSPVPSPSSAVAASCKPVPLTSTPAAGPFATAIAGVDWAEVAALMSKILADPGDTTSLMSLGNLYFGAGDYRAATEWLCKVVVIEPTNIRALLALGAARFNLGEGAGAKIAWLEVIRIDPNNVEGHYDLGFFYFQSDPQDAEGVRREWGAVIRLSPDSDVAKVVQGHLDDLASQVP